MICLPIFGVFAVIGLVTFVALSAITQKPGVVLKDGLIMVVIIVSYAIERHYLAGQAQLGQTSDSGYEFFWIDLFTGEVRRFPQHELYLQSLQQLGFTKEPVLTPIDTACKASNCQPCS